MMTWQEQRLLVLRLGMVQVKATIEMMRQDVKEIIDEYGALRAKNPDDRQVEVLSNVIREREVMIKSWVDTLAEAERFEHHLVVEHELPAESFESKAERVCAWKGYKILPNGFEKGAVFVEDAQGTRFPLREETIYEWINEFEGGR